MQIISVVTVLAIVGSALAAPAPVPEPTIAPEVLNPLVDRAICATRYISTVRFAGFPDFGKTSTVTKYQTTKTITKTLNLNCQGCVLHVETKSPSWFFGKGPAVGSAKPTKTVTQKISTSTIYDCKTSPAVLTLAPPKPQS